MCACRDNAKDLPGSMGAEITAGVVLSSAGDLTVEALVAGLCPLHARMHQEHTKIQEAKRS